MRAAALVCAVCADQQLRLAAGDWYHPDHLGAPGVTSKGVAVAPVTPAHPRGQHLGCSDGNVARFNEEKMEWGCPPRGPCPETVADGRVVAASAAASHDQLYVMFGNVRHRLQSCDQCGEPRCGAGDWAVADVCVLTAYPLTSEHGGYYECPTEEEASSEGSEAGSEASLEPPPPPEPFAMPAPTPLTCPFGADEKVDGNPGVYAGCYRPVGALAAGSLRFEQGLCWTRPTCLVACRDHKFFGLLGESGCACLESMEGSAGRGECGGACPHETYGYCGAADKLAVYLTGRDGSGAAYPALPSGPPVLPNGSAGYYAYGPPARLLAQPHPGGPQPS